MPLENDTQQTRTTTSQTINSAMVMDACPAKQNMMKQIIKKCSLAIEDYDIDTLYQLLEYSNQHDILISDLKTEDGLTLLHLAALKNMQLCLNEIVLYHKQQSKDLNLSQSINEEWVNATTNKEKFTALHYGSYVGNYEICIILIDMGANIFAKNAHGQNVLHIAAQGDQPVTLYFFHKIKGIPISDPDVNGSTPLHWACFKNSEVALIYILAWLRPDQMSIKDKDGNTPLHLSVKSCVELQHCRPTRALLYRGADREAKDKNGQRAIELVQDIQSYTLKKELVGYLDS